MTQVGDIRTGVRNMLRNGFGVEDVRVKLGLPYFTIASALLGDEQFWPHREIALRYAKTRRRGAA